MAERLPGDKAEYVRGVFAKIAKRYDLMNTLLSFNQDRYWRRRAVGETGLATGGRALDVCCGTGMLTLALAERVGPSGTVCGLDFSPEMLNVARAKVAQSTCGSRIELLEGDAMALPFPEDRFDAATIGFALRNVPDISVVLGEMRRVVRPGGRVVSLELAKPSMFGFKQLYYLYFEQILPLFGRLGVGVDGPYRWLPESLRRFPHQAEVAKLFEQAGFRKVDYYELTGGIVAIHIGVK